MFSLFYLLLRSHSSADILWILKYEYVMKLPWSVYIKNYLLGGTYMVYETFQTILTEKLSQRLGPDCRLLVQSVPKNNGITLDGLCISHKDSSVTPAIYLNNYFEQYQEGMSMEAIVEEIVFR